MPYRITAVQSEQSWGAFIATTGGIALVKVGCNTFVPGLGAAVDVLQAGYCGYNGDVIGCATNTITAIMDLCSFGLFSTAKEVVKGTAKQGAIQTAKVAVKTASKQQTKRVGAELAKKIATRAVTKGGKDAAVKMAKAEAAAAVKVVSKTYGELLGKDLARGLVSETVDDVFRIGSKVTAESLRTETILGVLSASGGQEVGKNSVETLINVGMKGSVEFFIDLGKKQGQKEFFYKAAEAATKAEAGKIFTECAKKDLERQIAGACLKAGIKSVFKDRGKGEQ